ncbi:hypothetical protein [Niabella ginsengisoli]|uniref:DUF1761 domain-containing protein n=1 Tax=Niabella ginsengisoli TaxID=522298 RepID=A0ABS9SKH3_9BACT|nr:hypothetical protein [Niabella ginsengisoli]MCH5598863.1 hypothetical protein [Niabella ginsengisoli]
MTFFVKLASMVFSQRYYVPAILGNVLQLKSHSQKLLFGTVIHYTIGINFAAVFLYLWHYFPTFHSFPTALMYGAVCGILAVLAWSLIIYASKYTLVSEVKIYLVLIFFGHLIFSAAMWLFGFGVIH